eukprot:TRINITY_DN60951_c0_g1_i1.p1 TRINITY_DN60951_c0_g1~~TRINITY_DN60951_c0_g1_i1.p1  ORF type:complete len:735 (+),score=78.16 TRINITY_DN60951_c0_g1_i1:22-2226(+)
MLCIFLLSALLVGVTPTWVGPTYYVATDGNNVNPGTKTKPFRTLNYAKSMLNEKSGGTVIIRGGTYFETLDFGLEDGGKGSDWKFWTAYENETVVVSAGVKITGWSKSALNQDNAMWCATLNPADFIGHPSPRQLWINGQRAIYARSPNLQYHNNSRTVPAVESDYWKWTKSIGNWKPPRGPPFGLVYNAEQDSVFEALAKDIHSGEEVMISVAHSWTFSKHFAKELDTANRSLIFHQGPAPNTWWGQGNRYYMEGARSFLDSVGEFWVSAQHSKICYIAPSSIDMNKQETVITRSATTLKVAGQVHQQVKQLIFQNIGFQHASFDCPEPPHHCDGQAASFLSTAAVQVQNAVNVHFRGCNVMHVGSYGLWLMTNVQEANVTGTHLQDIGGGGVRIGASGLPGDSSYEYFDRANPPVPTWEEIHRYGDAYQSNSANLVTHNRVLDGGRVFEAGQGIVLQHGHDNKIANNEIARLSQLGISTGWTWSYTPTSVAGCDHNQVTMNLIHDLGMNRTSDMGGIYNLGNASGTTISNNIMYNVWSYEYGGWGLYLDQASTGVVLSENIVYNTVCSPYNQHWGIDNTWSNNVFIANTNTAANPHRCPNDGALRSQPGWKQKISDVVQYNIAYVESGPLFGSQGCPDKCWWSDPAQKLQFNKNNYFMKQDPSAISKQFFPWNSTWQTWRNQRHQDEQSISSDPMFVDPENHDYRLKPNSPARNIGIKSIDTHGVGPQKLLF